MIKLTARQSETLKAIIEFTDRKGFCPSFRDIQLALNIKSLNGVMVHMIALKKKGYVQWEKGSARTLRIIKPTETNKGVN